MWKKHMHYFCHTAVHTSKLRLKSPAAPSKKMMEREKSLKLRVIILISLSQHERYKSALRRPLRLLGNKISRVNIQREKAIFFGQLLYSDTVGMISSKL